jgi:hypothetical protein
MSLHVNKEQMQGKSDKNTLLPCTFLRSVLNTEYNSLIPMPH